MTLTKKPLVSIDDSVKQVFQLLSFKKDKTITHCTQQSKKSPNFLCTQASFEDTTDTFVFETFHPLPISPY